MSHKLIQFEELYSTRLSCRSYECRALIALLRRLSMVAHGCQTNHRYEGKFHQRISQIAAVKRLP